MPAPKALLGILFALAFTNGQEVNVWTTDARSSNPRDRMKLTRRLLFNVDQSTGQDVLDVDERTTYQTIDGFGITLSDSSAWLIWNKMVPPRREHFLRSVFDRNAGNGLNVVRISIGASEFSTSNYTYDDTCCDLSDFTIKHDREYIIPILKTIKRWNPDLIIIGILWSPPAWMKINNSTVGGRLRKDEQSNFATYLTKFVQAYQKEGLTIHSIVMQNEPIHESCCYPSMFMDSREQAQIVKTKLGPVFRKYKLPTRILIYGQDWEKVDYPLDVLQDEEVKKYVGGTAFTCYGGTASQQGELHKLHPEQDIWLIECSDGLWNSEGKFEPLFVNSLVEDIVKPMRNYANGVLKRNLMLNQNNGPVNGGCQDCLGMVTLDDKTGNVTFNSAFYSFGHASKFVRSGARRIQSTTFSDNLESIAFLNPDGTKVLIASNGGDNVKMFKVQWGNMSFSHTLQPSSAVTFTWKGWQARKPAFERIEAESFSEQSGIELEGCTDTSGGCGENIAHVDSGDYLKYVGVDFGNNGISSIAIRYASKSTKAGLLELRLDAMDGKFLGLIHLKPTGDWQKWTTVNGKVRTVTGVRDLYLIFRGGDPNVGNVNWFVFNPLPNSSITNIVLNENAVYKIVPMQSGKEVLDLFYGSIKSSIFVNQDSQKFLFRSLADGCYKIGVKSSAGLVLGYDETYGDTEGAPIVQTPDRGGSNQRWRLVRAKDGYLHVVSCTNGRVWNVSNSRLRLSSLHADDEHRFSIVALALYANAQEVSEKYWRKE